MSYYYQSPTNMDSSRHRYSDSSRHRVYWIYYLDLLLGSIWFQSYGDPDDVYWNQTVHRMIINNQAVNNPEPTHTAHVQGHKPIHPQRGRVQETHIILLKVPTVSLILYNVPIDITRVIQCSSRRCQSVYIRQIHFQ